MHQPDKTIHLLSAGDRPTLAAVTRGEVVGTLAAGLALSNRPEVPHRIAHLLIEMIESVHAGSRYGSAVTLAT